MGLDLKPRCAKCGCELELGSMRALPNGNGFLCTACFEQGKSSNSPFSVNKNRLRSIPKPDNFSDSENDFVATGEDIFDQKEYICNSCGYVFKKKSDIVTTICPYCGKRDVRQKIEENADVLLD